jgi:hypothetical protein
MTARSHESHHTAHCFYSSSGYPQVTETPVLSQTYEASGRRCRTQSFFAEFPTLRLWKARWTIMRLFHSNHNGDALWCYQGPVSLPTLTGLSSQTELGI